MRSTRIIAAFVILNLGLGAAAAYFYTKRASRVELAAAAGDDATVTVPSQRKVRPGNSALEPASPGKFSWRSLESSDYRQYIANLRAIQCPEETIQDIIISEINKKYAGREAALKLRREHVELWELPALAGTQAAEKQKKLRELLYEKRNLIKELLGVDVPFDFPSSYDFRKNTIFEIALQNLPEEKREPVRAIQERYWERSEELQQRTRGAFEPEDQQESVRIRAERREAMAKLLTPRELEDLELRTSNTASSLRSQLTGFQPTEQEFREIFRVKQQLEEESGRGAFDPQDVDAQRKRAEVYQQTELQIKNALGDQRYAEYQRSQDYNYRTLADIAQRYSLPKEAALKGYDIQQSAIQEMQRLQTDQKLTPEQRMQAMSAIKTETEQAFVQTLGEKGYNRFKRTNPQWLDIYFR